MCTVSILFSVCFIKEEINCVCVISVFMIFFTILSLICSNPNFSYIVHVWQPSSATIPHF